jgi:hypothetical protein
MAMNRNVIDQHEKNVLQFIVNQLKHYSYREDVAEILNLFQDIIRFGGFKSDLDSDKPFNRKTAYQNNIDKLRYLVSALYKKEGQTGDVVEDSLFYSALFSFLLLLTKYAPTKTNAEEKELKPESRLLYPDGNQYHNEHNPKNFTGYNSFDSERTKNYIAARRQAIASTNPNLRANEIPTPTRDSGSHSRVETLDPFAVTVSAAAGAGAGSIATMILCATPVIAAAPWLIPVILVGGALGGIGVCIAAHYGVPWSIKNQFKRFLNFISDKPTIKPEQAENLFSYIKSQGNEPASELAVDVNAEPAIAPPPYSQSPKPAPVVVAIPQAKLAREDSRERLLPERTESLLSRFCGCLFSSKKSSAPVSTAPVLTPTAPKMCFSPSGTSG